MNKYLLNDEVENLFLKRKNKPLIKVNLKKEKDGFAKDFQTDQNFEKLYKKIENAGYYVSRDWSEFRTPAVHISCDGLYGMSSLANFKISENGDKLYLKHWDISDFEEIDAYCTSIDDLDEFAYVCIDILSELKDEKDERTREWKNQNK